MRPFLDESLSVTMPAKSSPQSTERFSIGSSLFPPSNPKDRLGPAHAELEALAAERLDEDDELELPASLYAVAAGRARLLHL